MRSRRGQTFVLAASLLAACSFEGLAFRKDTRLVITAPRQRATVTLPVTVTWEVSGVPAAGADGQGGDAGSFGVYIDRSPQPPGQPLEWFARNDDTCRASDGCPDDDYLAARGVHTTTATSFVIPALPPLPMGSRRAEIHEVTIAFLDGTGRRIGESAFSVQFEVRRDGARG